jgi:hypothetical protein
MKVRFLLPILAVMAGCVSQGSGMKPVTEFPIDPETRQKVAVGLAAAMKDPESMRLGAIRAGHTQDGKILVCGWVNAKNSFGGYTGDQPFDGYITYGGGFRPALLGGSDVEARAALQVCSEAGIPIG